MDHMVAVICVMSTCLWTTSGSDVIAGKKFQTSYHAVPQEIFGQELVISARSKIECAVQCRRHSQCKSFAFDKRVTSSSCYLQLNTSSTSGTVSSGTSNTLVVYEQSGPDCNISDIADSTAAVTIGLSSAGRLKARCTIDYHPQGVSAFCLPDGKWSPSGFRCLKRIWRYPETTVGDFPIPGTVVQGWSVCVEGIPTAKNLPLDSFVLQICEVCDIKIPLHTSWRFLSTSLVINDMVDSNWAAETVVIRKPFPLVAGQPFASRLTMNTTNTVHVYLNGVLFGQRELSLPLSSFSFININGDVNATRVEAWCNQ